MRIAVVVASHVESPKLGLDDGGLYMTKRRSLEKTLWHRSYRSRHPQCQPYKGRLCDNVLKKGWLVG